MVTLTAPTVEQHPSGLGIGEPAPRLSWRFVLDSENDDAAKNWTQTAYEIEVQRKNTPVESYHVASSSSVLVKWPSTPLKSRERVEVRVRALGGPGDGSSKPAASEATAWTPWTAVECGLLEKSDWTALPITSTKPIHSPDVAEALRPLRFRTTFKAPAASATSQARLYITGYGVYRAFLNGKRVGDSFMAPGWTSYAHRLRYEVFDIGSLLDKTPGAANVLAVEAAEGWYVGRLGFHGGMRGIYGPDIAVMAQVEVDGAAVAVTDDSWQCSPSAIVRAEIYDGEVYDARAESDWLNPAVTANWDGVRALPLPVAELVSPNSPPVRVTEVLKPVELITTPSGKTILDFGQNLVGRLRIRGGSLGSVKESGHTIVLSHAEVLENGELGTRPLRIAECKDTIITPEPGQASALDDDWTPHYTFHGFRYAQIDGWPSDTSASLLDGTIVAEVLHTDMLRTGHFECSHSKVNALHSNALWSMRGNFLSIPSDCPQRDERLGWTGDIQLFCKSANFLYNTAGILGDWLGDLASEQLLDEPGKNDGIPPLVVPNILQTLWPHAPLAIWDDVTVLTPWDLYCSYGDVAILRRQYESMRAWIDRGVKRDATDGLWDPYAPQLGDWLDPTAPPDNPLDARTNGTLVADAYLVRVTGVLAQISEILAETADAARYGADAKRLLSAFQSKYVTPAGRLMSDTQTANGLALAFGLFETEAQKRTAAARLVDLVKDAKFRVATGFAGTPVITHALSDAGHAQVAYRMLLETSRPSWMYPITMGATTIWERWDSMLPDGSVNPGDMTSFNHYMPGSVVDWLHTCVAGVRPLSPGWQTFAVQPMPGGGLTSARAAYETAYGRLESRWEITNGDRFVLDVLVPANSRAQVILPHEQGAQDTADAGRWVGSGRYRFEGSWDSAKDWPPKPHRTLFDDFLNLPVEDTIIKG